MEKSAFLRLLWLHGQGAIVLVLPEVVVREVKKLHRRRLEKGVGDLKGALGELESLGSPVKANREVDLEKSNDAFEDRFRQNLLDHRVRVLPIEGDLETLVDHAVAERKPFKEKSAGFRDAVIWEGIKTEAVSDEVVLISKNASDFALDKTQKNILHPDLVQDLVTLGLDEKRVKLAESIDAFLSDIAPVPKNSPTSLELVASRTAKRALDEGSTLREVVAQRVIRNLQTFSPGMHDNVTFLSSGVARIEQVEVADVFLRDLVVRGAIEVDEGLVLIELIAKADLVFSFVVDPFGVEWLRYLTDDADLEELSESAFQGTTPPRPVEALYRAEFDVATSGIGELERIQVQDDTEG